MGEDNSYERHIAVLEELLERERSEIKKIITGDIQFAYCDWIQKELDWIARIRTLLN